MNLKFIKVIEMKFKDLTLEQQDHFKKVLYYYTREGLSEQLEEATHITSDSLFFTLTKFVGGVESYYDSFNYCWVETYGTTNKYLYQKPEDYLTQS